MYLDKIIRDIEISKVLNEPIDDIDVRNFYEWFVDLFNKIEFVKLDDYPKSIFFTINGEYYFEQDYENETLWTHFNRIWEKISKQLSTDYDDTQKLIKYMVEESLKSKVYTPLRTTGYWLGAVEESLKSKVYTPEWVLKAYRPRVEESLKSKVYTPISTSSTKALLVEESLKSKVFTPGVIDNCVIASMEESLKYNKK